MNAEFLYAIKNRRSIYEISKESPISDDNIIEIVEQSLKHAPSAFNSQTARTVVLLGDHHDKLWDITKDALRKIISPEKFPKTEEKINSFKNGYGTVLFFEEQNTIKNLQERFTLYKDNFPLWSLQASGIVQFIVWTSLELEGFGASLQHYNEVISEDVKREWNIPDSWSLISQMPFGKQTAPAGEKEFMPLEERIKVFK